MTKYFMIVLFVCIYIQSNGQNKIFLQVIDNQTNRPVELAHVTFTTIQSSRSSNTLTDRYGMAEFSGELPAIVSVSFLGYIPIQDTVKVTGPHPIRLNPQMFSMDDVVVTGQALPQKADKSIYAVNVVSVQSEKGKSPESLAQLLDNESSIRITEDSQLGTKISMQGLSGQYVKILVDGIPMTGRMDGELDLSQIDLSNVDHIEIVEGPLSVVYGSGALAGTINIITREIKNRGSETGASVYGETVGLYRGDGYFRMNLGDHSFGVNAKTSYFDGWTNNKEALRELAFKPKTKYNGGLYYLYSHNKLRLKANLDAFDEIVTNYGEPKDLYHRYATDNFYFTQRIDGKVEATHQITDKYKVSFLAGYNYYQHLSQDFDMDFLNHTKTRSNSDTTQVNQFVSRMIYASSYTSKLNFSTGYDIIWEKTFGDRIEGNSQDVGDYAFFANIVYTPNSFLTIQPGARVVKNTRFDAPFIYSVNVLLHPTEKWQTRVSYARGFRSPGLKEMFLTFVDSNHDVHGNPNLEAETSYNLNASSMVGILRNEISYELTARAFYNSLDNMIELLPTGALNGPYLYLNVNHAITKGFGLDVTMRHHPKYVFKAGMTTTGKYEAFFENYGNYTNFNWFTDFSSSFAWNLAKPDIDLAVYYKYNGKQTRYVLANSVDNPVTKAVVSDFHMVDASVSKLFWKKHVSFMLGVKNLMNITSFKTLGNVPSPVLVSSSENTFTAYGRSFFAKLSLQFSSFK